MKRLILLLALSCLALTAAAQQGDALLTPTGTMFTINHERAREHPEVITESQVYLVLTARRGDEMTREIVPATRELKGAHFNPTIAYDSYSGMLFAFWINNSGMLSNQLMFASRSAEGVWSEAASFGVFYDTRHNLRIAVTRKFEDEEGKIRNGLVVHLSWWQFNFETGTENARYMLMSIQDGKLVDMLPFDLNQFVPAGLEPAAKVDENVLTQPLLFTSSNQDSVVAVFGDLPSGTMYTVRVTPKVAGNGRLRVPGGKRESNFKSPTLDSGVNRLEGVYGDGNRLALYTEDDTKLHYVLLTGGEWSRQQSITTDAQLSRGAVIDALRRLVIEH